MARYAETLPTDSLSSCVPSLFTCSQRKGKMNKGILLQQQIREREGKQPEAVQENPPSHVDHTGMRVRDQSTSKL